jgi:hypothetical protein
MTSFPVQPGLLGENNPVAGIVEVSMTWGNLAGTDRWF